MKILYISPLIPAKSGSGGKRAIYNHLLDLTSTPGNEVHLVCVDIEQAGEQLAIARDSLTVEILPRAFPRFESLSVAARIFGAINQLAFDLLPRAVAAAGSTAGREYIDNAIDRNPPDCVVVDHFFGYGLARNLGQRGMPVIYIAHNHEAQIWADRLSAETAWAKKLIAGIEWFKTKRAERRLVAIASSIVTLTENDRHKLTRLSPLKPCVTWPELSPPKEMRWKLSKHKTMLFVGSAAYFPNKDAINWLVKSLMPVLVSLDMSIRLRIVGTAITDIMDVNNVPNVDFLGFVDDETLQRAYLESTMFVSPVILGSGIKIKVIEALSYGLPVAVTAESGSGIEFIEGLYQFDRDNLHVVARQLAELLADPTRLESMSKKASESYQAAIKSKPSMFELLGSLMSRT